MNPLLCNLDIKTTHINEIKNMVLLFENLKGFYTYKSNDKTPDTHAGIYINTKKRRLETFVCEKHNVLMNKLVVH